MQASSIESPLQTQADLFLDDTSLSQNLYTGLAEKNQFRNLLNDTVQELNKPGESSSRGRERTETVRKSPVEFFKEQAKDLGLPWSSIFMQRKDLPLLGKVLKESGFSKDSIDQIMKRLANGQLTLDRIMATIGSDLKTPQQGLILTESSLPLLGRFLTELGFNPDQVSNVISDLSQGEKFSSETLRSLLLKYGQSNLKGMNLAGVDLGNIKDLLTSLGVQSKDIKKLWTALKAGNGRMSMEKFLNFLDSLGRPNVLTSQQKCRIKTMIQNLRLKNTIRIQPTFNRIISLIQAMGSGQVEQESLLRNSPAVAILRSGAVSARTILNGGDFSEGLQHQNSRSYSNQGQGTLGGGLTTDGGELAIKSAMNSGFDTPRPSYLSESIIRQISEIIAYSLRNNRHRIKIQLVPPELGQIKINISYKNNQLQTKIVTENGLVKHELELNQNQLRKIMADQGINLDRFDVFCDYGERDFPGKNEAWSAFDSKAESFSNVESAFNHDLTEQFPDGLPAAKLNDRLVDLFT